MGKLLLGVLVILAVSAAAFAVSPWPGVLIIRAIFDRGAATASERLHNMVPAAVTTTTLNYDPGDDSAILDIYRLPESDMAAPMVVWVHGGGFVSGRRADVANYLKILAGRGVTVVNVDYTIAPEARYPSPLRQVTTALTHLSVSQERLGVDASRIVLAGDSAGAQIAAQTAAAMSNPAYAALLGLSPDLPQTQVVGALLFCGVYDIGALGRDGGVLGWFVETAGWAYSGTREWREDAAFASIDFLPHLTPEFPPAFISAGNADPLEPQSVALADALDRQGVRSERLFFPADHQPPLGHEYQFDLTTEAGSRAFEAALEWLTDL